MPAARGACGGASPLDHTGCASARNSMALVFQCRSLLRRAEAALQRYTYARRTLMAYDWHRACPGGARVQEWRAGFSSAWNGRGRPGGNWAVQFRRLSRFIDRRRRQCGLLGLSLRLRFPHLRRCSDLRPYASAFARSMPPAAPFAPSAARRASTRSGWNHAVSADAIEQRAATAALEMMQSSQASCGIKRRCCRPGHRTRRTPLTQAWDADRARRTSPRARCAPPGY